MRKIWNRFYSDFLLPSRMNEYRKMLLLSIDNGYEHLTLSQFADNVVLNKNPAKIFIHRHDIDTDIKTARQFFEIEKKMGIKSSYYFRLSTIDIGLMQEINAYGSEVGYHFEEIAQYCKDNNIHTWEEVVNRMPSIQSLFSDNFKKLESRLGFKMKSVVAHGDFVNRILKHQNNELLTNELRIKLGIELEGYDDVLVNSYKYVQSDKPFPQFYRDKQTPEEAIREGIEVIYLLTHPRHWKCSPWVNLKDNLQRLKEGEKYKH